MDFSDDSKAALQQAARMAKWNGANLHVLHVIDSLAVTELAAAMKVTVEQERETAMTGARHELTRWLGHTDSLKRVLLMTPTMALSAFGYYVWRTSTGAPFELVRSETFTVLAVCQSFNVLNCRSELKSALNFSLLKNCWLLGGLALGNVLHFFVINTEPMNRIFHTVRIPATHFFLIGAVASLVLWVEEIRKVFARRRARQAGTIS